MELHTLSVEQWRRETKPVRIRADFPKVLKGFLKKNDTDDLEAFFLGPKSAEKTKQPKPNQTKATKLTDTEDEPKQTKATKATETADNPKQTKETEIETIILD